MKLLKSLFSFSIFALSTLVSANETKSLHIDSYDVHRHLNYLDLNPKHTYDSRTLNNGKKAFEITVGKLIKIEGIGDSHSDMDSLTVMFGFVKDTDVMLQNLLTFKALSNLTPNPEKSYTAISDMMSEIGKKLSNKKNKSNEIIASRIVDNIVFEIKLNKALKGISIMTMKQK